MHSPIITLSSVEVPVSDLERAIRWYEQALGYLCTWSDQNHAMLENKGNASSTRILLVKTNDTLRLVFRSTNTGIKHSAIDFETDDLEKTHAHLAGIISDLEPIPQNANKWAPRGFGFDDCEGNRLAIFSYGNK